MARKMRKFADGGSSSFDAKMARKTADIESDYKKALAKGKNADVAKAKYEQRMADAKDDYAKWTKADRSMTRANERAAEATLSEARRTGGRNIATRDMMEKDNKPIEASTDVSKTVGDVAKPTVTAAATTASRRATGVRRNGTRTPTPRAQTPEAGPLKSRIVAAQKALLDKMKQQGFDKPVASLPRSPAVTAPPPIVRPRFLGLEMTAAQKAEAKRKAEQKAAEERAVRSLRPVPGFAKGGKVRSVNGIAKRGLTRAPMKKGK